MWGRWLGKFPCILQEFLRGSFARGVLPSMARSMRFRVFLAVAAIPLLLWGVVPLVSSGQTASVASLQSKIQAQRKKAEAKKAHERVISRDIQGYSRRINNLQDDITVLQARQVRIQADLDAKRRELARIQEKLRQERLRLARLRARLAEARRALATRMVELYKADRPDMVTVILEADGFADLLERTEFMQRVSDQDARIINRVRDAKAEATATERGLDSLERRQQRVAGTILKRRDEVAAIKNELVDRRQGFESVRSKRTLVLNQVRQSRKEIEGHIAGLEREQSRIQARLAGLTTTANLPSGPVRPGSGGFIWPVNGGISSPFGFRWGRLHAGVDIPAAEGTPIRAAKAGKVVLLGWTGGYGNYTCISHGGGISTCYAHQSSYATSNGASVSQGQVIGAVGNTGHSFGAHLHFEVRINGSPVNPMGYL
jgi:murein DD-endopeptidase MepM/ murein hydrolase activator NlpD